MELFPEIREQRRFLHIDSKHTLVDALQRINDDYEAGTFTTSADLRKDFCEMLHIDPKTAAERGVSFEVSLGRLVRDVRPYFCTSVLRILEATNSSYLLHDGVKSAMKNVVGHKYTNVKQAVRDLNSCLGLKQEAVFMPRRGRTKAYNKPVLSWLKNLGVEIRTMSYLSKYPTKILDIRLRGVT